MYQQAQANVALSVDRIRANLAPASIERVADIDVQQALASTNSALLAKSIHTHKAQVCVAEAQLAGRGRRGNEWQSAPHKNIMLSLSWGFQAWPDTITGLGLAVALVTVEALNADYGLGIQIKWPNDIMVDDAKLGGILIDMAGDPKGACNVVIGLGLNVHQADWSLDNADYQWQDLAGLQVYPDRNVLIARFIACWLEMLQQFEQSGFRLMTERWNQLSSYAGKRIRVIGGDEILTGTMQGVDAQGALRLVDELGHSHLINDSNVSIRLI